MSLIPVFNMAAIEKTLEAFADSKKRQGVEAMIYAGELFVNLAREHGTYTDRTGNLRNSIGYAIAENGRVSKFALETRSYQNADAESVKGGEEARSAARNVAEEVARENPIGHILIGFAGMEYAAAVESRGYDVISGYMPEVEAALKEALRAAGFNV
jgi:hypothetical protein